MIVSPRNGTLQLIRQTDHAKLAGQFAIHWGRPPFDRPEPLEAVIFATMQHDRGWTDWDASPKVNPATQEPYQFWELPVEEHLTFYFHGVQGVIDIDHYAGLLVSMHCAGLYNGRYGTDPSLMVRKFTPEMQKVIQGFLDRLEAQQRSLREQLQAVGTPERWMEQARIWKNYKLLQIFDRLSLYLCMPPFEMRTLRPAPSADGEDLDLILQPRGPNTIQINPYPFGVDPLQVLVASRQIPTTPYAGNEQFREALARAKVSTLTFELTCSE
jgi:hypothetical protein